MSNIPTGSTGRIGTISTISRVYEAEKLRAAKSMYTPSEILVELAKDSNEFLRVAVAENLSTPPKTLHRLSKGFRGLNVKKAVASNPKTSVKTLARLAGVIFKIGKFHLTVGRLSGERIRMAVAGNPSTPLWLLEFLLSEEEYLMSRVTAVIAGNPNISEEMFEKLVNSDIDMTSWAVHSYVAANPALPVEHLRTLASNSKPSVKVVIASRRDTPADILEVLSRSVDVLVRINVAANVSTPVSVLEFLLTDLPDDKRVTDAVINNSSYIEHQRALTLENLNISEDVLPAHLIDEIWHP